MWTGFIGIILLLLLAYGLSANRQAIQWRLVITGLILQWVIAIFVLKVPLGQQIFGAIAQGITGLLAFSDQGAAFAFGPLVSKPDVLTNLFGPGNGFIFAFRLVPTIIFVATLVGILYHLGWMQRVVQGVAWVVFKIMRASGAEALSNAASIFVGQIEAQLMIKPYVPAMTQSELLAVMSGSMACISGALMVVLIQMGISAPYLLTASLMAAPGALVISKLVLPETEASLTQGHVTLNVGRETVNLVDAAAHGASDGMRIGIQVVAMVIGFVALVALADNVVYQVGLLLAHTGLNLEGLGLDIHHLSLKALLGVLFSGVAWVMGVPWQDSVHVGSLMGTKLVANEFLAFADLSRWQAAGMPTLQPKSVAIATFALCGFANFSSVAMQIGGIGEIAPNRKADLARLGLKALLCGTMASYMSAAIAGIVLSF